MQEIIGPLLKHYAAYFSIINPVGCAFIFYTITSSLPVVERRPLVGRVTFFAWAMLVGSYFGGIYLLKFFGISIPVLRVAGGIIVALVAWDTLNSTVGNEKKSLPGVAKGRAEIAFFPLTMPLTVGPGTISVAIALAAEAPSGQPGDFWTGAIVAIISISLIALTIYYTYSYAGRLTKMLGKTGSDIIERMSGFLLFCIGIQIIWVGARELLLSLPKT